MRRFRRLRSSPKSPKNWCEPYWRNTLTRKLSHCRRSPCPTLRATSTCSWSCRLGLKVTSAVPAPKEGWRAGWQTALLTLFAIGSDGRRSDTGRSHWDFLVPFPTRFGNSQKRNFKIVAIATTIRPLKYLTPDQGRTLRWPLSVQSLGCAGSIAVVYRNVAGIETFPVGGTAGAARRPQPF